MEKGAGPPEAQITERPLGGSPALSLSLERASSLPQPTYQSNPVSTAPRTTAALHLLREDVCEVLKDAAR